MRNNLIKYNVHYKKSEEEGGGGILLYVPFERRATEKPQNVYHSYKRKCLLLH